MFRVAWGAILVCAGALEWWGIVHPRTDKTLSEFTRWSFRTHTKVGKVAFVLTLALFARHILKKAIS